MGIYAQGVIKRRFYCAEIKEKGKIEKYFTILEKCDCNLICSFFNSYRLLLGKVFLLKFCGRTVRYARICHKTYSHGLEQPKHSSPMLQGLGGKKSSVGNLSLRKTSQGWSVVLSHCFSGMQKS